MNVSVSEHTRISQEVTLTKRNLARQLLHVVLVEELDNFVLLHPEVLGPHIDEKSHFEAVVHCSFCVQGLLRIQDGMLLEEVEA